MNHKNRFQILLSYGAIYIIWGSTYLFIKLAVKTIPVSYILAGRFLIGGIILIIIGWLTGQLERLPNRTEIISALIIGCCLYLGGNGLVTIAEKKIDSYIAALIISSIPFVVAFFNKLFFKINISFIRIAGIMTGIFGVAILLYDGNSITSSFLEPSILLVFAAISFWGFGTSIAHRLKTYPSPFINTGIQMLIVSILMLIPTPFITQPISKVFSNISFISWISFFFLSIFGTGAILAYNYLLVKEPTNRITSYSLVNPVIAVFLGSVFDNEQLRPYFFFGLPLVLIGLTFMLYGDYILSRVNSKFPKKRKNE
jgi:drug/metabolite transporter (DMT)-like permease